jgi:simple sugar transport system permease protein
VLQAPGAVAPESREFADSAALPLISNWLNAIGLHVSESPLNLSIVFAVIACVLVWALVWHTPWGYELRLMGFNPNAALYAGARPRRITLVAMCLSGALAGFVGVNELLGVQHRLLLDFALGYGFGGIAVALMGRNHPLGIMLAGILFGILQQGGTELSFDMPQITREMVLAIQGLVILFSGALALMTRPWFEWPFRQLAARRRAPAP